jgi:hypothetical protein
MGRTISTKKQCMRLLEEGILGNRLRLWDSLEEIKTDKYNGTVTMRHKGTGGGLCIYEVQISDIPRIQEDWIKKGVQPLDIYFNESAPDSRLLIQGELMQDHWGNGLYLFYSRERKKMRDVLRDNGKHINGLNAKLLLQKFVDPSSYEDLQSLLELYPDHVIEFGAYEINLGNIPNRNTIVWEVRKY